jgi:transposase
MPDVIRIALSPSERRALTRLRRQASSKKASDRITSLLLLGSGMPTSKVLEALSISRRTLLNWKQRWLKEKVFGLEDKPHTGRPPVATPKYIRAMVRTVRLDPRALGFAFTRWTAPRLAEYLARTTGIRLTANWVSELLRTQGFVWRKTKRTIRNLQDPKAKERAQKRLRRLKKGSRDQALTTNSGSPMESGSTFCP